MVKIVFSKKFLEHKTVNHPENRERLDVTVKFLQKHGMKKFEKPDKIGESDLLAVHSPRLISQIKNFSLQAEAQSRTLQIDDNFFSKNTFEIAMLACGSALKAARLCGNEFAFSLARPPGHHAGKDFFMGFCYFNNIAFAVKKIMEEKGFGKAMILDFDLHHGNGTQNIFLPEQNVYYLSLHQDPSITFPNTGFQHENTMRIKNVAIEAGATEDTYLEVFENEFLQFFERASPDLLAVSAGFDILGYDTAVGNKLKIFDTKIFEKMGKIIAVKKVPCFGVLEGGYALEAIGESVFNFLNAFK
ncbi:MAG TPA: histone deacetylase [archaeon]|nr:histone deacetylase [archaeon]